MNPEQFNIALQLARIPGYDNESPHRIMADVEYAQVNLNGSTYINLRPRWGSSAAYYRVTLNSFETLRLGWMGGRVILEIDAQYFGTLPFTLYVGDVLDEPSMLVKFPEVFAPDEHKREIGDKPMDLGTWVLTGRRSA